MSYPPSGAKTAEQLGGQSTARVVLLKVASKSGVFYTVPKSSVELWEKLKQVVSSAALDRGKAAQLTFKHFWKIMDSNMLKHPPCLRIAAQAHLLAILCSTPNCTIATTPMDGALSQFWLGLAKQVAHGMLSVFKYGMQVSQSCNPFEVYDRTMHTMYTGCFHNMPAQRTRMRVNLSKAETSIRNAWEAALDAHWKMLQLEVDGGVFVDHGDMCREDVLCALNLLASVPDNLPKRVDAYDMNYWMLRVVSFGVSRNISNGERCAEGNVKKAYCLMHNVPNVMVCLKILTLLRATPSQHVNLQALKIDRHDIENACVLWNAPKQRKRQLSTRSKEEETCNTVEILDEGGHKETTEQIPRNFVPNRVNSRRSVNKETQRGRASLVTHVHNRVTGMLQRMQLLPVGQVQRSIDKNRSNIKCRLYKLDMFMRMHKSLRRVRNKVKDINHDVAIQKLDELQDYQETSQCKSVCKEIKTVMRSLKQTSLTQAEIDTVIEHVQRCGLASREEDSLLQATKLSCDLQNAFARPCSQILTFESVEEVYSAVGHDAISGAFGDDSVVSCTTSLCKREFDSLVVRLQMLNREALSLIELPANVIVPLPITCREEYKLRYCEELPTQDVEHDIAEFNKAHSYWLMQNAAFSNWQRTTRDNISNAINRCFETAKAVIEDANTCSRPEKRLKLPDTLVATRLRIAKSVVNLYLSIACLFKGLSVFDSQPEHDDDNDEHVCIVAYIASRNELILGNARNIVQNQWRAATLMIVIAELAEPYLLDCGRKQKEGTRLLIPAQYRLATATEGPPSVDETRRGAFLSYMTPLSHISDNNFWPQWPPRITDMVEKQRLQTAICYGRASACAAFSDGQRLLREPLPRMTFSERN